MLSKKSLLADERNFLAPMVRPTRGNVRDHIESHKSDRRPSYMPYRGLRRRRQRKTDLRAIFGGAQFSTFSTASTRTGHPRSGSQLLVIHLVIPSLNDADHSVSPALRSIDVISAAQSGLRAFICANVSGGFSSWRIWSTNARASSSLSRAAQQIASVSSVGTQPGRMLRARIAVWSAASR